MSLFDRFRREPVSKVRMLVSYGGDLVAGEEYELDPAVADALIVKGFADGELSRTLSDEEIEGHVSSVQTISI